MNFQEKIKNICDKYKIPDKAKKEISSLIADSYIKGSNDCDELTKKYYYLHPKNIK